MVKKIKKDYNTQNKIGNPESILRTTRIPDSVIAGLGEILLLLAVSNSGPGTRGTSKP